MNSNWHNVSRREPCPVCHKPDWCTISNDGAMCVCRRVESDRPARSGVGWIHRLGNGSTAGMGRVLNPSFHNSTIPPFPHSHNFTLLHAAFDGHPDMQEGLAFGLGLDGASFAALDVRYDAAKECMSFPMRNPQGEITGLRYRHLATGRKWSEKGSRDGLFMPREPERTEHLVITEGPTDTAAALSLGLNAVGRSSCLSGVSLIRDLVHARQIRRVTIVADHDRPGMDGAHRLAAALPVLSRILVPPEGIKDMRDWYRQGLTRTQFDEAANAIRWQLPHRLL